MEDQQSSGQALEFALKTFAFGLFAPQPGARSLSPAETPARWRCTAEPTEIPGAPGFTTLAGSHHCCLGITPEGDVHRWTAGGSISEGGVARGFGMEWSLSVLKDEVGHRLQLRDIAIGNGERREQSQRRVAAVALMDSGDVFTTETWYADGGDGSEGSTPLACPDWHPVSCLQSTLVVSVACGAGFCTALTAHGELLAWGESPCGALGLGSERSGKPVQQAAIPTRVLGALSTCRVAAVACGDCHVVAAAFDEDDLLAGEVFAWGSTADNRLGLETSETSLWEPKVLPWLRAAQLGDRLRARREGVQATDDRRSDEQGASSSGTGSLSSPPLAPTRRTRRMPQRITQVSCGSRHSVVVCQGGIICFGANDQGQLGWPSASADEQGLGLPSFAYCPELWEDGAQREAAARRVCCGPLHTAAVSSQGQLHLWGLDLFKIPEGLLGMDTAAAAGGTAFKDGDSSSDSFGLRRIQFFGSHRPVVALACGAHFVVASAEVELPSNWEETKSPLIHEDNPLWCAGDDGRGADPSCSGRSSAWRPAHLPPKPEEESERHRNLVRELERSVQRRLAQEQQEASQQRRREEIREKRLQEHTEIWLRELLPTFVPGSRPVSARMERLWRQGLPPRVREVLWPIAIGNVLRITPELFQIHKQRALDAHKAQAAAASDVLITLSEPSTVYGREKSTNCIPFDLPRTFPTLAFFCEGGPLHEDCARILEAYTFFRPDIGYVQGMSFLAAMLLLYLPAYPAFVGLCNLLNTPSVLGLYTLEPQAVACRARLFRSFCAQQLPAVARCIDEVGLMPEMFLIEWFITIFAKCLPLDVASVIWDLFLLDGEVVLYCTAIALFRILEPSILHPDGRSGPTAATPDLESISRSLGEDLRKRVNDPDELLWHVREVWRRAPPQLLEEIRAIENTEFGATPSGGSGVLAANMPRGPPAFLASVRAALVSRWTSR